MAQTLFLHAHMILEDRLMKGSLLVDNDKIAAILSDENPDIQADHIIDLQGRYLSPGFIDIHTHGGGGCDFMDGTLDSIYHACRMHLIHGTTSIVPTTITSTRESLTDFVKLFNQVDMNKEGMPHILGLHLEGPYFSYHQRGAQDPKYLRNPQKDEYEEVFRLTDRILRWSFAIELDGASDLLDALHKKGIISSLAHSDATCQEVEAACKKGLQALTHFYSGMSDVKRINAFRVAGAVQAGYLIDDLYIELIVDGCHLPKELVQLAYKIKGPDRICFVTDSMRAAGMPDGSYILGNKKTGLPTIVEDGVAKLPDRTAFAGSVATADRLFRTGRQFLDIPLWQLTKMLTLTPAALLHISDKKGSLKAGKDADLIILNESGYVEKVMVMGRLQYENN